MEKSVVRKATSLGDLAPAGVPGNVWVQTLKEQLLSSKNGEPTNAELLYFARVCQASGLDPAKREIYGIYRNVKQKDGTYKPKLTIQTSIDGLRVIAERSGKYAGSDEPEFVYDDKVKITIQSGGSPKVVPNVAKVSVIKIIDKLPFRTTRTANWADFYPQRDEDAMMWKKFPETMLAKVAEAQALRVAFPNETSGLYIEEEMMQTESQEEQVNLSDIKKRIDEAKDYDDLMEILEDYPPDIQKQITAWVNERAKELKDAPTD